MGNETNRNYMYTFMVDGTTVVVSDFDGKASLMYVSAPSAKKLTQLPHGEAPNPEMSVTKEEVMRLLKEDSGKDIDPIKVRMTPSGFSSALNGGAIVEVGGDPINAASWNYTIIFDSDKIIGYYMRGTEMK